MASALAEIVVSEPREVTTIGSVTIVSSSMGGKGQFFSISVCSSPPV